MALSEKTRHELHSKLEQVLGPNPAGTLMAMLPPVGWADVATKRDLDALGHATKRDLEVFQQATKRDLEVLQQATKRDLEVLQQATKRDLEVLQQATKSDMETLEHKLVATFMGELGSVRGEMAAQTRTILLALVGILVPYAGVILAAAKLA